LRVAHVLEFDDGGDGDQTMASATVQFGQGTSAAFAWGQNHRTDDDYQFVGLGHSYGEGTAGVYYKQGQMGGTDGSLWGVGVGHDMGGGVAAYAGYRYDDGGRRGGCERRARRDARDVQLSAR